MERPEFARIINPEPIIELLSDLHGPPRCSESELPGMWLFQLQARLGSELRSIDPAWGLAAEQIGAAQHPPIQTFRDLLHHPQPPLHLLEMSKEYAKIHLTPAGLLPSPVAGALYCLAIGLAQVRCGTSISSMQAQELNRRLRQLRGEPWLDESTRALFDELLG